MKLNNVRALGACILTIAAIFAAPAVTLAQVITLDANDKGRVFEGLGAVSAGASSRLLIDYPEPQRSEILDYLFKPGYGAALQHLKVEVGSDVNSTDGSEASHSRTPSDHNFTRGYEWWLMEEAKKRNPDIVLDILPWGAPGWIGNGNFYSADMVNYILDFIKGAQSVHHLHIDYVGIWNERMYDGNYVKDLANALRREHLDTKIVCCDSHPGIAYGEWSVMDGIKKDADLANAIAVVGVHYPRERRAPPTPQALLDTGIDLWSSEDQPNPGGGPFLERSWAVGGHVLAKQYISNYIDSKFTKTEIWSPITSYYDSLAAPNSGLMYANTPWSGHYDVQGTIWVTAHTTQFASPGWHYLDSASGRFDNVSYVSLRSPDMKQWSVVLETIDATKPETITFLINGGLATSTVHVWETNDTHTLEKVADIPTKDGSFHYTFAPGSLYSLTTTTGQGRHISQIPPAAPFPFPYSEDFEQREMDRSPQYFADQNGAFEVNECGDRPGKCLVQQIELKPIPWMPMPNPFTLMGDHTWRDYAIDVDVRVPKYAAATIIGRIDSANIFEDHAALYPSGYVLTLNSDGNWQVSSTAFKKSNKALASGSLGNISGTWHHVQMVFRDSHLVGKIDQATLFDVEDTDHSAGQVAIGSSWSRVAFDNFSVTPH